MMKFYILLFITLFFTISETKEQHQFKHPHHIEINDENDNFIFKSITSRDRSQLNSDALIYYLRLVKQIFRRQRFKIDPRTDDFYIANIPLKLTKEQYELLLNPDALNLNEIDNLVEEIFRQSKDEDYEQTVVTILFDYYRQEIISSITSFSSPIIWISTSLLAIWIMSKFFRLSKLTYSAMIIFVIFIIIIISYSMTYFDCMNELEVDQMIQLSKQSMNNPCKDYDGEHESVWSSMIATILGSAENKCHEHMRKTFKSTKKFCDPLDVFAKWSAKIQMSYFGSMFGEFLELLSKVTSSSNLLTKIMSWVVSLAFFCFLMLTLIKLVIKFSIQGAFGMLSTTPSSNKHEKPSTSSFELLNSKMDALLMENENMKRELSVIRECSVERSLKDTTPPPSIKRYKLESIEESASNHDDDH